MQLASLVTAPPEAADTATGSPTRTLVFIGGLLAAAALIGGVAVKLPTVARRSALARWPASRRNDATGARRAAKLAVAPAPPLQPAEHAERLSETEDVLRQLLRDLERSGVIEVREKGVRPAKG